MKLLMDADCLIKLTKAGLKELVADNALIDLPETVKCEVVDAGKVKGCMDSFAVEQNIASRMIKVIQSSGDYVKGDHALIALFAKETYDAVATDDAKLTRNLRAHGIPFILPGLIINHLQKEGKINLTTARWALDQLTAFISEDEFSMTKLLLEKEK
jgi:rRNA-processing protein FCF1